VEDILDELEDGSSRGRKFDGASDLWSQTDHMLLCREILVVNAALFLDALWVIF